MTARAYLRCVSRLQHARGFRDLAVYQRADQVAAEIFDLTKQFPREEIYSLTDQIRRSSRSVGAQIAEAWGKRRYQRSFIAKLVDADAEQLETQHWVRVARRCGYLTPDQSLALQVDLDEIGRMLHSMIAKAHKFCRRS